MPDHNYLLVQHHGRQSHGTGRLKHTPGFAVVHTSLSVQCSTMQKGMVSTQSRGCRSTACQGTCEFGPGTLNNPRPSAVSSTLATNAWKATEGR